MDDEIDLDEIADRRDRQEVVRKQYAKWIKRQRKARAALASRRHPEPLYRHNRARHPRCW
jgi:hypothetical protein